MTSKNIKILRPFEKKNIYSQLLPTPDNVLEVHEFDKIRHFLNIV